VDAGAPAERLAWDFHAELAALVVAACERVRVERTVDTVALTGGCYQNTLLLGLTVQQLRERGFAVLTHSLVPPNDGGVALGQAVVAAQWMRDHAATEHQTDTTGNHAQAR
jgi:hydrogenase maturation protein HypF